jgi:6-pyruvoyltetrahydropterin/6-carboxytetrahydropterin synthase
VQHSGEYHVSVGKDHLVFASAHFITLEGHRCEGLHGHNYHARVTVSGRLNDDTWWVVDFVELKRIARRLCDALDHVVLLPLESRRVRVSEQGESVCVAVDGTPRYTFPRRDCALLPIPNTTAELLAKLLADRVRTEIGEKGAGALTAIEVEVEESPGQSAIYRTTLE